MSYRPLEVQGEGDGVVVGNVVAHHRRVVLAEGAQVRAGVVDVRLVVLQAHAELDVAGAGAAALGGLEAAAAVALRVELDEVLELGEPQLEHALALGGDRGDQGRGGREEGDEGDGSRGHLDGG